MDTPYHVNNNPFKIFYLLFFFICLPCCRVGKHNDTIMIGLQVLRTSEGFEGKYRRPFSVSRKFIPCGHIYGTTVHSVIRANPQGGQASRRRADVAAKNGRKITHVQGMNTPFGDY